MIPEQIRREVEGPRYPMLVKFYEHPTLDGVASTEKGRPIYKTKLFVWMKPTSPQLTVKDPKSKPATQAHIREYPEEYARYEAQKGNKRGRPLSLLPSMNAGLEKELADLGVFTLEQLADIDPAACAEFMLKHKNIDEASDEQRAQMIADAARGAESIRVDFAEQIREAEYYARPVQEPAVERVDESDRGREDGGSVQERREFRPVPSVPREISYGTFQL